MNVESYFMLDYINNSVTPELFYLLYSIWQDDDTVHYESDLYFGFSSFADLLWL